MNRKSSAPLTSGLLPDNTNAKSTCTHKHTHNRRTQHSRIQTTKVSDIGQKNAQRHRHAMITARRLAGLKTAMRDGGHCFASVLGYTDIHSSCHWDKSIFSKSTSLLMFHVPSQRPPPRLPLGLANRQRLAQLSPPPPCGCPHPHPPPEVGGLHPRPQPPPRRSRGPA